MSVVSRDEMHFAARPDLDVVCKSVSYIYIVSYVTIGDHKFPLTISLLHSPIYFV